MSRVEPFLREIEIFTADLKSPEARSKRLADFARQEIEEIRSINRSETGHDAPPRVTVDGREGAPLESVKPNGVIVAEFDLLREVLEWIGEQLLIESPRLTGRYERSHVMFVDGVEHEPGGPIPPGDLYTFVNVQPYARKIERGLSPQAPDGVYEAIAAVASRRFGNIAKIYFSFRSVQEGQYVAYKSADSGASREERQTERDTRQPAIIVRSF